METIAAKFGTSRIISWHRQEICTPGCRKTPFFGAFCHTERDF
ncbi:gallidermin family protein [Eggerthellaceae bacterium zg-893]|nr:gallidermin family protein [Eggerthellaceae bacterium zg-893]